MNKLLLTSALVAAFGAAALAPQAANANDGTININGAVTGSTCTVKINGAAGPATITLPTVSTTALSAIGDTAGQTAFAINLSGCAGSPTATKASTFFENGPNVNAAGRLVNTGTATGVDVQLVNSDNSVITAGSAAPTTGAGVATITANAATLNYYARYYATGTVGAGSVASSVQFSVIYQ
ncbi:fimbrial protein [Rhodanobacter glycinis]|uniref:Major type 1 subunit fimbrin (Pilin) n=1 Tax=Rhodanobacter glycinis TaxID=582702 RepID=A0A1I3Z2B6_9GAMM|nr:fimbrial protein [Rhodanobacter glycinis]SFK37656.1 major type 1 subunit fimbrin (pilin) [Rhodanobacter glycinis]